MECLGRHRSVPLGHEDVRGRPLFAVQTSERTYLVALHGGGHLGSARSAWPHHGKACPARDERPRGRRAAKQRDELASRHSITSSARCCRNQGTSRPSALAVLRLITSSNFVGCSTGISAGFPPCKILTTNAAARRKESGPSAP